MRIICSIVLVAIFIFSASVKKIEHSSELISQDDSSIHYAQEIHLKNVRQLTFGGDNAEAYFSFDNKKNGFQATQGKWEAPFDPIFFFELQNLSSPLLRHGKRKNKGF